MLFLCILKFDENSSRRASIICSLHTFIFKMTYIIIFKCISFCVCACMCSSVMSDSLWHHALQPSRLLYPWGFPAKNTGASCHFLLQVIFPIRDGSPVSCIFYIGTWLLDHCAPWKLLTCVYRNLKLYTCTYKHTHNVMIKPWITLAYNLILLKKPPGFAICSWDDHGPRQHVY